MGQTAVQAAKAATKKATVKKAATTVKKAATTIKKAAPKKSGSGSAFWYVLQTGVR